MKTIFEKFVNVLVQPIVDTIDTICKEWRIVLPAISLLLIIIFFPKLLIILALCGILLLAG